MPRAKYKNADKVLKAKKDQLSESPAKKGTDLEKKVDLSEFAEEGEAPAKKPRKPVRFKPGTVALRKIRKEQKDHSDSFQKLPFRRFIRDLVNNECERRNIPKDMRISERAFDALQSFSEDWLTAIYRESNRLARNADRVQITDGDVRTVFELTTYGLSQLMDQEKRFTFGGKTMSLEKQREKGYEQIVPEIKSE